MKPETGISIGHSPFNLLRKCMSAKGEKFLKRKPGYAGALDRPEDIRVDFSKKVLGNHYCAAFAGATNVNCRTPLLSLWAERFGARLHSISCDMAWTRSLCKFRRLKQSYF